jgi:hypothetical protein
VLVIGLNHISLTDRVEMITGQSRLISSMVGGLKDAVSTKFSFSL